MADLGCRWGRAWWPAVKWGGVWVEIGALNGGDSGAGGF